jgi:hypothetical protein
LTTHFVILQSWNNNCGDYCRGGQNNNGANGANVVQQARQWQASAGEQAHHVLSVSHMKIKACPFSLLQFITLYKLNKS